MDESVMFSHNPLLSAWLHLMLSTIYNRYVIILITVLAEAAESDQTGKRRHNALQCVYVYKNVHKMTSLCLKMNRFDAEISRMWLVCCRCLVKTQHFVNKEPSEFCNNSLVTLEPVCVCVY